MRKHEFMYNGNETTCFDSMDSAIVSAIGKELEVEGSVEIDASTDVTLNVFVIDGAEFFEVWFGQNRGTNCRYENLFDLDWFEEDWKVEIDV